MNASPLVARLRTLAASRRVALAIVGGLGLTTITAAGDGSAKKRKRKKKNGCAKAGQATSKKLKRCCTGLAPDGSGRCACVPVACPANVCGPIADGCGRTLTCGPCAGDAICVEGRCQPCTVVCRTAPTDCAAALETSMAGGGTVYVCPGVYDGMLTITRSVTVIGAGQGEDPTTNTILRGVANPSTANLTIAGSALTLAHLHNLRVMRGNGGVRLVSGHFLTMTDCTITENVQKGSDGDGAGLEVLTGGDLTLTRCTVFRNRATTGGGIMNSQGHVTLVATTISENESSSIGGGIRTVGGTLTIDAESRVMGNRASLTQADPGGGLHNANTFVSLASTSIVSGNLPDNCGGTLMERCLDELTLP